MGFTDNGAFVSSSALTTRRLSMAARSLWAKTGKDELRHQWEPLYVHLADTAETARLLWQQWVPEATKAFISDGLRMSQENAENLAVWLAGVHDIGKATPSFQSKVPGLSEKVREAGLCFDSRCENYPHSFMGETICTDWLKRQGCTELLASGLASIVGGHHGVNTASEQYLRDLINHSRTCPLAVLGDEEWRSTQNELLDWVSTRVRASGVNDSRRGTRFSTYVQIQLTGLVIMADWIASNTHLFPLVSAIDSWEDAERRAVTAWQELKLPLGLAFDTPSYGIDELFHHRFASLPPDAALRPVQREAVQTARSVSEPGLVIIEAPMGSGKTEASLLCAEILAKRFGEGGLAYLLPTQATSNAMFSRVKDWLELLLQDSQSAVKQDLHLLHGKAALNDDYASLPTWGVSWMGDNESRSEEAVIAHQWFGGRKRGLLAPFVVGTVDQLLMAALNTRHAHLRHFGLSGKVVIIDEVHAYDAYMNVYLDRAVSFLGAYKVPVILLSATLPPSRRSQLVNAYRGHDSSNSRRAVHIDAPRLSSGDPVYPLVTASLRLKSTEAYRFCEEGGTGHSVAVDYLADDDDALICELREALIDGGCACVLRDTVARAQATYELLRVEFDNEVRLTHSRFVAADRARNDAELVTLLGPKSENRPERLIVVGTQVLEQSLDVDFDLLISDVAPIDLLLQRMGRLHRHTRGEGECGRPVRVRKARCLVTGVTDWETNPPEFARGIDVVYQPAILWRTILALRRITASTGSIVLPDDIAPLVESVYEGYEPIPEAWETALAEADRKADRQRRDKEAAAHNWLLKRPGRANLDGWMRGAVNVDGEAQGRAAVRDSQESIEVVVTYRTYRGLEVLPWVAERLGVDSRLGSGSDVPDDNAAHAAALCTVCLPPRLSSPRYYERVIIALERSGTFDGWQSSRWLSGLLPLVIDENGMATIGWEGHEFILQYTRERGLSLVEEKGGMRGE